MTDDEIKKALECCTGYDCENCKALEYCDYMHPGALARASLDIINRQKAEIEGLKKFIEKDQGLILKLTNVPKNEYDDKIKSEAIKEFERKSEKRLIELYEKYHKIANKPMRDTDMFYQGRAEAIWECIDANRDLVKEMMEVEINQRKEDEGK